MNEPPVEAYELQLPHGAEAAALARRFVAEHAGTLPEHLLHDAETLVSELVTNAVLHGRPAITLRMSLDPPLIGVAVEDAGELLPVTRNDPAPEQTHGRGLMIVQHLASRWGVDPNRSGVGKSVWFHLEPDDTPTTTA